MFAEELPRKPRCCDAGFPGSTGAKFLRCILFCGFLMHPFRHSSCWAAQLLLHAMAVVPSPQWLLQAFQCASHAAEHAGTACATLPNASANNTPNANFFTIFLRPLTRSLPPGCVSHSRSISVRTRCFRRHRLRHCRFDPSFADPYW